MSSDYELGTQLGRGSQGVVYRAKRKIDGKLVAIKKVFVQQMSKKEQMDAANEIRALKAVDHPHVIRYLDSFQEDATLCIVTELAEVYSLLVLKPLMVVMAILILDHLHLQGGNLMERLKLVGQRGEHLPERTVWKYFLQTTLGLCHIHNRNILHRDVKVTAPAHVPPLFVLADPEAVRICKDSVPSNPTGL
jgi:serine/threonine protein kinase